MGRNAFLARIEYFGSIKKGNEMVITHGLYGGLAFITDKISHGTYLTAEKTSHIHTMLSTINAKNLSPP